MNNQDQAKKNLLVALLSGDKQTIDAAKSALIQQYRNVLKKPRKRILQAKAI